MFLKRLELVGFKSFAARTTLDLDRGISVFVGPNGSGKSNLADAVRWVLGEQSARAVRGKRGEDVIFAGSATRQPLGMAEVSLVLDNSEGRLPLPFAEVRVSRRLYRSGESEYLVNGSRVRLKDVLEYLAHAGLGPDTYAVIGQGAVDELILQRAEERRLAFEAAADIRRHQAKLAETRGRLESAEQNLTRCKDLVAELEPHLRRLKGQADRAERAQRLRAELASLATCWYRTRLREVQGALDRAEAARGEAVERRARIEAALADQERARRSLERRQEQVEACVRELRPQVERLMAEHEQLVREAAVAEERAEQLARQASAGAEAEARLRSQLSRLESELALATRGLEAARAAAERERASLPELERRLQAAEREAARQQQSLAGQERSYRARSAQLGDLERQQARLELRLEAARAEAGRWLEARRVAEAGSGEAEGRLRAERARLEVATVELQRLGEARERLRRQHAQLAQGVTELERETVAAERLVARLEVALAQLGADLAPAEALPAGLEAGAARVVGTLAERLFVPARYERAVGAALGELARALVVAGREDLERLAGRLAREDGRWVLAAGSGQTGEVGEFQARARALLGTRDELAFASELVEAPAEVSGLGRRLLGRTVVAPAGKLAEVVRRLEADPSLAPWQVVDLEGNVARSGGEWLVGRGGATDPLLAHERERRRLADELAEARTRLGALGEQLDQRRADMAEAGSRLEALAAEASQAQVEVRLCQGRVAELERERDRQVGERRRAEEGLAAARQTVAQIERERDRRAGEIEALRREVEALRGRLAEARAAQDQQQGVSALRAELAQAKARAEVRAAEARAAAELHARVAGEARAAREALERTAAQRSRQEIERRLQVQAAQAALARLASVEAELAPLRRQLAEAEAEREQLSVERRRLDEALARFRGEAREVDAAVEAATLAYERLGDELRRLRREAAGVLLPEDQEAEDDWPVQLRLALEPPMEVASEMDEPIADMEAARRRIASLQRELRSQGAAPEGLLEEYRELSARHAFLTEQSRDLQATIAELRQAMAELQGLMAQRFGETFARVDAAFRETFAALFGGGTAQLVLTRPDDLLETGVDIVARPPGKRLQGLMSLSGGERALTSVALLFALLKVNPTPFVLLDEVDAALDESNVQRFADLLRAYAGSIQFVVVTHNRATMEVGDALFGVSMEAGGVSKVLSLRLTAA